MANPIEERFRKNIFYVPFASNAKNSEGVFCYATKMPVEKALEMKSIQINGPRRIAYLAFDIDSNEGSLAWLYNGLPQPTIITINPKNLHAHFLYELKFPVWKPKQGEKGNIAALNYMKSIYKAMCRLLKADFSYTGFLVNNPLHPEWRTIYGRVEPYTLTELAANLDLDTDSPIMSQNDVGRNCTLFNSVRKWAYKEKKNHKNISTFRYVIDQEIQLMNDSFSIPLNYSELRCISKSITNWVWIKYTGEGKNSKNRGICNCDSTLDLSIRQRIGQEYTSLSRNTKTKKKLKSNIEFMNKNNIEITKSSLAKHTNININTVRRHWTSLELDNDYTLISIVPIKEKFINNLLITKEGRDEISDIHPTRQWDLNISRILPLLRGTDVEKLRIRHSSPPRYVSKEDST